MRVLLCVALVLVTSAYFLLEVAWIRVDQRAVVAASLVTASFEDIPVDPWGAKFVWFDPRHPQKGRYSTGPNKVDENGKGDDLGPFDWPDSTAAERDSATFLLVRKTLGWCGVFLGLFALTLSSRTRTQREVQGKTG